MSKYTAEQVRIAGHGVFGVCSAMLLEYAALLRERESAKAAVTDALKVVLLEHRLSEWTDEDGNPLPLIDHLSSGNTIKSGADEIDRIIDAVEEAVAPMLANARVPERTSDMTKFVDGLGWVVRLSDVPEYTKRLIEQTRDLLAAAPKPKAKE